MKEKWIDEITIEYIPEVYHPMVNSIGIENFINLCKDFGGTTVYVPKHDSVTKILKYKKIKEEYSNGNYKELAVKYGLSERWIRDIVKDDNIEGQINIFEIV